MPIPLHIVILNHRDVTHPEAGGAEIYLQEIFDRVAAFGHHVTLICSGHGRAPREERIGKLRILRVGNQATVHVVAAIAALRLARHERVDVFVESLCKLPFLLPAVTRIPVVPVVLHLFGDAVFREANFAVASYVWLSEKLIPPIYRGLRFVALSPSTAADLNRRGVQATQIDIVPPGLDLTRYRPAPSADSGIGPMVVYVGRLKRYKGLDVLLRAFVRVRAAVPDARLVFVGKGDDRTRLERLAQTLDLERCVKFAGFVAEEEKIDWLRRACVVVYPSPREGWGMATLEAAACGTPVLASDAEGLRDAVCNGKTGFLVPHGDDDAWAGRLTQLLTDPVLRAQLGAAAHEWAGRFDWARGAETMHGIVKAVAAGAIIP